MCFRRRAVFTTCGHTQWGAVMHGSWPGPRPHPHQAPAEMDTASQVGSARRQYRTSYASTASAPSAATDDTAPTRHSLERTDEDGLTRNPTAIHQRSGDGDSDENADPCAGGRNKSHPYLTVWIDGLCQACEARRSILLTRLLDEEMDDTGGDHIAEWGKDVELAFELDRRSTMLFNQSQSSRSSRSVSGRSTSMRSSGIPRYSTL
ncbi:hypothetical protein L228DRAFT_238242 [Xylona heveae TC161]|uniref:Uncharacterized protein n=1 Tax=Xylona heveae (strain CBS 132557 / TC161) TaxID=1328760 RepID=A0A165HLY3_XYLHT|nr:hypothetical protein L228DRAFT_238242 [Xylona heveae TC161]KZF23714.1 hypothetical protein L228DRAFT_238242 [Xylona heveae TC161]